MSNILEKIIFDKRKNIEDYKKCFTLDDLIKKIDTRKIIIESLDIVKNEGEIKKN